MLPCQVQSSPTNNQLLSIASVKRKREEGAATLPSSADAITSYCLICRKPATPPFLGGMELPVLGAGRAEAAGNRTDFCLIWYIRSWVLQKSREDGYEILKENVGSRDTHSQRDPRLGKKQNLSPN